MIKQHADSHNIYTQGHNPFNIFLNDLMNHLVWKMPLNNKSNIRVLQKWKLTTHKKTNIWHLLTSEVNVPESLSCWGSSLVYPPEVDTGFANVRICTEPVCNVFCAFIEAFYIWEVRMKSGFFFLWTVHLQNLRATWFISMLLLQYSSSSPLLPQFYNLSINTIELEAQLMCSVGDAHGQGWVVAKLIWVTVNKSWLFSVFNQSMIFPKPWPRAVIAWTKYHYISDSHSSFCVTI